MGWPSMRGGAGEGGCKYLIGQGELELLLLPVALDNGLDASDHHDALSGLQASEEILKRNTPLLVLAEPVRLEAFRADANKLLSLRPDVGLALKLPFEIVQRKRADLLRGEAQGQLLLSPPDGNADTNIGLGRLHRARLLRHSCSPLAPASKVPPDPPAALSAVAQKYPPHLCEAKFLGRALGGHLFEVEEKRYRSAGIGNSFRPRCEKEFASLVPRRGHHLGLVRESESKARESGENEKEK